MSVSQSYLISFLCNPYITLQSILHFKFPKLLLLVLSLNSPIYQVYNALVEVLWLLYIVHVIRVQPAELASVAQLVRASPRKQTVMG